MEDNGIPTVPEDFADLQGNFFEAHWEEPLVATSVSGLRGSEVEEELSSEVMAEMGFEAAAQRVRYRVVDLRGKIPGSPKANQGTQRKTAGTIVHYNGPATNVPRGGSPVALYHNDARYHMSINWGGGARANGIQYHQGIWEDTVYILRNRASILWHCGSWPENANTVAVNIPIGQGQRATKRTLLTTAARIKSLNARQGKGVGATRGHQEVSATLCPGTLMADFVRPFRTGGLH